MSAGISLHKDTPGFKVILRAVLKDQIQLLVQQLSTHGGEESLLLTSCIEDGSFSHLSSKRGSNFLERNEDVRLKFLNHVARDGSTKKLPIVTSPSSKRDSSNWRMRLGFSGFNSGSRKSPYERRTHRKSYRSQKSLNSKDCAPFTIRSQSAKNAEFTFETQSGSIIEPNVNKLIDGPIEREDVDGANIAEDQEYDPMISGTNEVEGDDNVNAVEAGNSVIVKVERLDGCVDDNLLDTNDYTIAPEVGTPASVTSSRVQQARPTSTKSDTDYTLAPESGTPASVNSPRSQHARSASPKSDTGLNSVVNKRKKAVPTRRPPGGTAFYPKESPFSVDTQSSEVLSDSKLRGNRNRLTLKERVDCIKLLEKGRTRRSLAKEFKCGKTQITALLKRKREILKEYEEKGNQSAMRRRGHTGNAELNELVHSWYLDACTGNAPVTGPIIQNKAKKFATYLGLTKFKASNGWLHYFQTRHNIVLKKKKRVEPSESVEPGESGEPSESVEPSESGVVSENVEPDESGGPDESGEVSEYVKPSENVKPRESVESGESVEPGESGEVSEYVKPSENVKPRESVESGESVEPGESGEVSEYVKPSENVKPRKSVEPGESGVPDESGEVSENFEPSESVKPGESVEPVENGRPDEIGKPVENNERFELSPTK
ncbi:uncharacterized protein LOC128240856 isoform X3 [Mya arenaria]|uniref:uncharacterized protein LOC128240856 isoform X3 n=1 Tax=Mya arenaria TaxID=6604 RepID=UPI0022E44150|nr:uncharacterized protein LOC128240856 isoform X3 [Mya arenaria]